VNKYCNVQFDKKNEFIERLRYLWNNLDKNYDSENFEAKDIENIASYLFESRAKIESKAEDFIFKAHQAASEYYAIKTYYESVSYFIISRN
jgi:hypothetical protein